MGFADTYLEKHKVSNFIKSTPNPDLGIVIIIPCYNEPDIINTLTSIKQNKETNCSVEVIVCINSSEITSKEIIELNKKTLEEINNWSKLNSTSKLSFHCFSITQLPKKYAGAGLARKYAMDEALFRYNTIDNKNGVIVSFDADSLCSTNYLQEIENKLVNNKKTNGACLYFEHPLEGDLPIENYQAISLYELYLRYYRQAMKYTGFPFAYHTIGSCFAVKANTYMKQGGMNKKQAGEDFYFLHKIIPLGNFIELNNVKVVPSSRISDRVPFGTGKAIEMIINDANTKYLTYNIDSFNDLKALFIIKNHLFKISENKYHELLLKLPESIKAFLQKDNFFKQLNQINNNCKSLKNFETKFFTTFNAFKILKFLNFSRASFHKDSCLIEASDKLLKLSFNIKKEKLTTKNLLLTYRDIEKHY